ncbi:MAG: MFS transporter [Caldisphaeraceae archaeon]|nr:MFS transporter [Caldisphaeraceae archaeon]MEB3797286.1 MFS transporter [Caldisphaeraceae archaeon]
MIGTIIEWYDIFIFSTGAIYIGKELFPSTNPVAAILGVLLVFALGFATRPIGAFVFGHWGDKRGRKYSLIYTLLISGISSGIVGLLPTYQQIGVATIIILVILRLILGFGLGGEWGGAVLLLVENSEKRRAFYSAFIQSTVGIGLLIGSAVFLGLSMTLPSSAMYAYGWRIPFLGSFVMVAVGLAIRLKVSETKLFEEIRKVGKVLPTPSTVMFKKYWKELTIGTILAGSVGTVFYVGAILIPLVYKLNGAITSSASFLGLIIFAILDIIFVFLSGYIADKVGRRPMLILSNLLPIIAVYPAFLFRTYSMFFTMMVLFGIFHGLGYSPLAAMLSEIYPTNIRYTGSSSSYQYGNSFLGGPASYVSSDLGAINFFLYPVYMIILAAITIGIVAKVKETKDISLE